MISCFRLRLIMFLFTCNTTRERWWVGVAYMVVYTCNRIDILIYRICRLPQLVKDNQQFNALFQYYHFKFSNTLNIVIISYPGESFFYWHIELWILILCLYVTYLTILKDISGAGCYHILIVKVCWINVNQFNSPIAMAMW